MIRNIEPPLAGDPFVFLYGFGMRPVPTIALEQEFILPYQAVIWYYESMKKSLLETNPYLKDTSKRTKALARNIETSSAIEGIRVKRDAESGRFVAQSKNLKVPAKSAKSSR